MLYTSYYARQKYNHSNPLYAISVSQPEGFSGMILDCVIPPWSIVSAYKNSLITENEYKQQYIAYLNSKKDIIEKAIRTLPDNSILLCYEAANKFCHRHILAEFITNNFNIPVTEWTDVKQESLF